MPYRAYVSDGCNQKLSRVFGELVEPERAAAENQDGIFVASRMIRRCLDTLYCEAFDRSAISFTLICSLNSRRRIRSRVSSPKAFNAAMQSSPVTEEIYP